STAGPAPTTPTSPPPHPPRPPRRHQAPARTSAQKKRSSCLALNASRRPRPRPHQSLRRRRRWSLRSCPACWGHLLRAPRRAEPPHPAARLRRLIAILNPLGAFLHMPIG